MRRDELKQPLHRRGLGERLWSKRPGLLSCAYMLTSLTFVGGGYWASQQNFPLAGEPVVVVSIPPAEEIHTASTTAASDTESAAMDSSQAAADPDIAESIEPESAADAAAAEPLRQEAFQPETTTVTSASRPLTPAPLARITETSEWGPLPKISDQGEKPSRLYARPTSLNVIHSDAPKIALLLGGMGLNKKLTLKAIKDLPAEVTLGFAPYGNDLQEQVDRARKNGHEVFLQVPLEPVGFPATNPGPKTLLGDGSEAENISALRWHLSRFSGYAGVVNYMGGRFLSMPRALKPVLSELKARGIVFLEDGSLALSSTENAAKLAKTQVSRAKVVIDADPSPQSIISALTLLEEEATGTGFAVGTGSGLEVTIDTVREWAKAAAERGIILVPITASYQGRTG